MKTRTAPAGLATHRDHLNTAAALLGAVWLGVAAAAFAGQPSQHVWEDFSAWEFINFSDFFPEEHALAAMNNAGQVVGSTRSSADAPSHDRIFRWDDGVITMLRFPGQLVTAIALSESGVVLGTVRDLAPNAPTLVLIWRPELNMYKLFEPAIAFWPADINDDLLVCGLTQDGLSGAVLDGTNGQMQLIGLDAPPPQPVGTMGGLAINNGGAVAGQEVVFVPEFNAYFERPYLWTAQRGATLLPLTESQFGGRAVDVNHDGDVVGTVIDDSSSRPALWTADGDEPIVINPPVNFFVADATTVNSHRHIGVVAPNDLFGFTRAFIWTGTEYVDLTEVAGAQVPGDVAWITHLNDSGEALIVANQGLFISARGILRHVKDTKARRPAR
jgi:hypothetical protein